MMAHIYSHTVVAGPAATYLVHYIFVSIWLFRERYLVFPSAKEVS